MADNRRVEEIDDNGDHERVEEIEIWEYPQKLLNWLPSLLPVIHVICISCMISLLWNQQAQLEEVKSVMLNKQEIEVAQLLDKLSQKEEELAQLKLAKKEEQFSYADKLSQKEEELANVTAQLKLARKEEKLSDATAQQLLSLKKQEVANVTELLYTCEKELLMKKDELAEMTEDYRFLVPYNLLQVTGRKDVERLCNHKHRYASCDMETQGGGWITIQRRINCSVNFDRNWIDYEHGFGDLNGDFWYGLHNIHILTNSSEMVLRIEIGRTFEIRNTAVPGIKVYETDKVFHVDGPDTGYSTNIDDGSHRGDADEVYNMFYTRDRDTKYGCAAMNKGGWWYCNHCGHWCSDPNFNAGIKFLIQKKFGDWVNGLPGSCQYERVSMKIRPINYNN